MLIIYGASNFTSVDRNREMWAACLLPNANPPSDVVPLTRASQNLFRRDAYVEGAIDPPSPLSDVYEDEDEIHGEQPDVEMTNHKIPGTCIVMTDVNLSLDGHRAYPVPNDPEEAFVWTETQRLLAAAALKPETPEALQALVCSLHSIMQPCRLILIGCNLSVAVSHCSRWH